MKICIAVCARNEQNTIINTLNSLVEAAKYLEDDYYFHVCINGSTDNTVDLVNNWKKDREGVVFSELTKANLVEAQRSVIEYSKSKNVDATAFFDGDIKVDNQCLKFLVEKIKNPRVKAAYAVSIPIVSKDEGIIEKSLNQYDCSPTIFSERFHLHGRAFIIKDWNIPKLPITLAVDDIYLSFYLLSRYGSVSIEKVEEALIYFYQVKNYSDYFKVYRRRNKEIFKCLTIFPEFNRLPKEWVNRRLIKSRLIKESPERLFYWAIFFLIRKIAAIQFKIEQIFFVNEKEFWKNPTSSKKVKNKPLIILFEGLDCSGKKTVASLVSKELLIRGYPSTINTGPLTYNWLKNIIRLISLNPCPNSIRSLVYSFDGLGDNRPNNNFSTDIVLQISSPLRSVAYAQVMRNKLRLVIAKFMSKQYANYDRVYYFTCDYGLRIKRHLFQKAEGLNSDEIKNRFPSRRLFEQIEDRLLQLIDNKYKIDHSYDTSSGQLEGIVEDIVNGIIEKFKD